MNPFKSLLELPIRRAIQVLRNQTNDLSAKMGYPPIYYDQHPGKVVPFVFSKMFGPIVPVDGTETIELDPPTLYTPTGTNILVPREASFYWVETNAFAFAQTNPDGDGNADIFDAESNGGGGTVIQNFQGPQAVNNLGTGADFAAICFEVDLYDKKRGRSITNGRIPSQLIQGGAFDFRSRKDPPRWDPGTEIEPRVWVTDARAPGAGDSVFFLNLVFKGYTVLQEANLDAEAYDGGFAAAKRASGGGR